MPTYCSICVTPSSRPRVQFNSDGVCNACLWHEQKKKIDWNKKQKELASICDHFRRDNGFDIIIPCSGGKDGSYVAWKMKHEFNMHPLCITFKPQLPMWIGRQNLENFQGSGFDHLLISPDPFQYKKYAKDYFIKRGMPNQPFVTGISTSILQYAIKFDIPFIMYGEQGEQEYGGNSETVHKFNRDFLINVYYEGQEPTEYGSWWQLPKQEDLDNLFATWYSLYDNWDPEHHAIFAKKHCGLQMLTGGSIGTFTNYSQIDSAIQDLHTYLMFCKFGMGRCTSDASIEIRHGRMSRDEGVKVVNLIDGQFPLEYLPLYLDYFEMSEDEFWDTIQNHVNFDLLVKTDKPERPYVFVG